MEETAKVEGRVMELASEVDKHASDVNQVLRQKTTAESQLKYTSSLVDAVKTENYLLATQLRNVKVKTLIFFIFNIYLSF